MHYLVYVSSASHLMRDDELSAILQVLEGAQDAVARTFSRIERDPRHSGLIVLRHGETKLRDFSGWAMGFRALRAADLAEVPGFVQLAHRTFTHLAMRALKQFHEGSG